MYELAASGKTFVCLDIMILMEHAEGQTLRSLIEENRATGLRRRVIFVLFKKLMTALEYIHEKGLIHRDIKPENIFIDNKNFRQELGYELKLGDFGLAKICNNEEKAKSSFYNKKKAQATEES